MSPQTKTKEGSPVKKHWWQRIRIVYRPAGTLSKVVVLSAIVLSTVTLLTIYGVIQNVRSRTEKARQEAARQEYIQSVLKDKLDKVGTQEFVEEVAKEVFGWFSPDGKWIAPITPQQ